MLGVRFRAHLPKGVRESYQSILQRGDGAFSAILLPLSGKELLLQPDGRRQRGHYI
jgi:hypothetical protein